jgi:hypothetical protein
MKRIIVTAMLALPLAALCLLPKPASAEPANQDYRYGHQSVSTERDNRNYINDRQRGLVKRDDRDNRNDRYSNNEQGRGRHHRQWISARFLKVNHHRAWVPGHYEFR